MWACESGAFDAAYQCAAPSPGAGSSARFKRSRSFGDGTHAA
eukprot:CAMPEP_0195120372 /NCGR_PEP_ID=MMETSP0448-20130528/121676_1 /TAXON_ID=66468 /ORGANISM="Heterocapsa triquestra, Strain CCMP 448" /LENGTH=41 /DNA_ID= /DNA_START= /DNA_END= /DNA_ORIENTATION=